MRAKNSLDFRFLFAILLYGRGKRETGAADSIAFLALTSRQPPVINCSQPVIFRNPAISLHKESKNRLPVPSLEAYDESMPSFQMIHFHMTWFWIALALAVILVIVRGFWIYHASLT